MRGIVVEARRTGDALSLAYRIEGKIGELVVPAPGLYPLWQHTCCEAFVARPGSPAYHEFNFSPSGDWAGYAFTGYREGGSIEVPHPGIVVRSSEEELHLKASVAMAPGALQLGLCVVIEEQGGRLSYWALRHAPGGPDFHHRDAFALELA